MAPVIGIDLGTTFSCVAVFTKGKVEIIANSQGSRTLPSYVAFNDTEKLVGDPAKRQVAINPQNTIFDAKRLIGRRFDDQQVQEDIKHWPFGVICNLEGKPMMQATYKGELKTFAPEEISSMILVKLKETAEAFLDMEVKDAVITVPAYFSDSQRQATKDAGTIAGLNVLRIINEPTAAALAYGLQKNVKGERNVLIYDLGGGTFDVTILTITDGSEFIVKSTFGDTHLGGEDFDSLIVKFLVEKFKELHNKDISDDPRAMRRLRIAAEDAKLNLSSSASSSIRIDSLFDGKDFCSELSRPLFDELCLDLFKKTLEHVKTALSDANMDQDSIHDVVLVGGSTRIPKVQELLREFFSGKELNRSINPDEAVAYGAAVQAAMLSDDISVYKDIVLVDVTPMSLGVQTHGGVMSNIIERNTQIPYKHTKLFTTVKENQTGIEIAVFEGERGLTKDNNFLGNFVLLGIPPKPAGDVKLDVTFDLDENSILKVSVVERSTGASEKVTIRSGKSNLSAAEIDRLRREAERYKADDKRQLERITARNNFEFFIQKLQTKILSNSGLKDDDADKNGLSVLCDGALIWVETNLEAAKEDYEEKMEELKLQSEKVFAIV